MNARTFLLVSLLTLAGTTRAAAPNPIMAFSLREAATAPASMPAAAERKHLAGITRLIGFVHDPASADIILIGKVVPGLPSISLADVVTGLRARLVHDEWPLVSIDPTPETSRTGQQDVRLDGHIASTQWGLDFVLCDIALKKHSLGLLAGVPPLRSYREHLEDELRAAVAVEGSRVRGVRWLDATAGLQAAAQRKGQSVRTASSSQCRFWFYPMEPQRSVVRGDVFCIKELRLGIKAEELGSTNHLGTASSAGAAYAGEFTRAFDAMARLDSISRLKGLYDVVAIAEAVRRMGCRGIVHKLMRDYEVPSVETPTHYPLDRLVGVVDREDGQPHLVSVAGGIQFTAEIEFIEHGDVAPLREVVLKTRPSPRAVSWRLPLDRWNIPNSHDLALASDSRATPAGPAGLTAAGCSVGSQSFVFPSGNGLGSVGLRTFDGLPDLQPPPPLSGVTFVMQVGETSFLPDPSSEARALRDEILNRRPAGTSLLWRTR